MRRRGSTSSAAGPATRPARVLARGRTGASSALPAPRRTGRGTRRRSRRSSPTSSRSTPSAVEVRYGDSFEIPDGTGTFGSRSVAAGGSALLLAARELRAQPGPDARRREVRAAGASVLVRRVRRLGQHRPGDGRGRDREDRRRRRLRPRHQSAARRGAGRRRDRARRRRVPARVRRLRRVRHAARGQPLRLPPADVAGRAAGRHRAARDAVAAQPARREGRRRRWLDRHARSGRERCRGRARLPRRAAVHAVEDLGCPSPSSATPT